MAPSSSSPETLPIISIAPYLPATAAQHSDADRAAVAKAMHEACRDIGFFYLNITPFVKQEDMTAELEMAREFFHRPEAEKDEILLTKADGARGESPRLPTRPCNADVVLSQGTSACTRT